jgi:hypothetical protein
MAIAKKFLFENESTTTTASHASRPVRAHSWARKCRTWCPYDVSGPYGCSMNVSNSSRSSLRESTTSPASAVTYTAPA